MTHRHRWILQRWPGYAEESLAYCAGCDAELYVDEVNRRLRATEALSAEDAEYLISILHPTDWKRQPILKALKAYARALEAEDA